jgi:hypothetical protein
MSPELLGGGGFGGDLTLLRERRTGRWVETPGLAVLCCAELAGAAATCSLHLYSHIVACGATCLPGLPLLSHFHRLPCPAPAALPVSKV